MRVGPGLDYPIDWVFVRSGLPLEIIQEFGNWRRIRDWNGKTGWVFHSLLSGRRNALVAPWQEAGHVVVYARASESSRVLAWLEPMARASIRRCDGEWCKVTVQTPDLSGFVRQTGLWGVYPGESVGNAGWW